ncbi:MAG: type II secretion system protein [Rhodocyclaceae bacterium]|nr:type II secretion system protein [Rhodocyclaceae bacterium]
MSRQHGFGAIAAIVVLVILAVLSAAIVSVGSTQQLTSAQDVMSTRAWQAARAGNEWALYQALKVPGTFSQTTTTITVTRPSHGWVAGNVLYLDFPAANDNLDGSYTVAAPTANTFTVTSSVSQAAAGSVNLCVTGATLDLTTETGFRVTVTCDSRGYNEGQIEFPAGSGTLIPRSIGIYTINAIACPAASCPASDASVAAAGYVERSRAVIATN